MKKCLAVLAVLVAATHLCASAADKPGFNHKTCAKPVAPPGAHGALTVKVRLDRDGNILETGIHKSSGNPQLDAATMAHVVTCTFGPQPTELWALVPYVWLPKSSAQQPAEDQQLK